jgi:hypothetical protein
VIAGALTEAIGQYLNPQTQQANQTTGRVTGA